MFVLPAVTGSDWVKTFTSVAIYSVVALGLGVLYGRVGMISLGQIGLLAIGTLDGDAAQLRLPPSVSGAAPRHRGDHLRGRGAGRTAGSAALGPLPGVDHADVRRRREHRPDRDQLPERRQRLHRSHDQRSTSRASRRSDGPAGAAGDTAYYRYVVVVCALMFLLALVHVAARPGRAWASIRESEPAALAGGRERDALQAVGVRARVVHDGRRRVPARLAVRPADDLRLPDPGLADPARGGADRRHLQPLGGRRRRRLHAARAVHLPGRVARQHELPADHLRRRLAAGAADRPGRARRPGAEGPGEALAAPLQAVTEAVAAA